MDSENVNPVIVNLEQLPGTEYSRFAIPVDYMPSRDYEPRWGHTRPPIEALDHWFRSNNEAFRSFVSYMLALDVEHIATAIDPGAPLKPAWIGGAITAFDVLAEYAMVLLHRPAVYLEIGSGMTTCFARQAISDGSMNTRLISIDPDPRREVDAICDEVIREGLESCDLTHFDRLEAGDILFFDGSHRSFMNSDVTVFFIDVLPRIKPGVLVHIHDIHLPWDYPAWTKNWYWNEQYLLAVYLMGTMDRLEVLLPTAWFGRSGDNSDLLQTPVRDLGSPVANLSWTGGGSLWFTKKSPHEK